jgi:O-antigen ligase
MVPSDRKLLSIDDHDAFDRASKHDWPVSVAGFLYALSMHKFTVRSPLEGGAGAQGVFEALCLLGGLFCIIAATRSSRRAYRFSPAVFCFSLFGVIALCSSWRSFSPALSFGKAVLFLTTIAGVYLVNQAGKAQTYFAAIFRAYTFLVMLGLFLGLLLPSMYPLFKMDEETGGRTRLAVFADSPGFFGSHLTLLLLAAPLLKGRIGWLSQVFLIIINILSGGKTSTGLLLLLMFLRLVFAVLRDRSKLRVAIVVSATLALPLALLVAAGIKDGPVSRAAEKVYGDRIGQDAEGLDGRADLWMGSIKLLPDVTVLGYGFSGARDVINKAEFWAGDSHNGYLEMALTGGVPAFFLFLFGVVAVGVSCSHAPFPERIYLLSLFSCIVIFSLIGTTFTESSYFGTLLLVWLYYRGAPLPAREVQTRSFTGHTPAFSRDFV